MEPSQPEQQPEQELTRAERRKLKRHESRQAMQQEKGKKSKTKLMRNAGLGVVALLGIVLIALLVYSNNASTAKLERFSQCLAEKGVVIYGNNWCKYTQKQMHMFSSSFKNLKYVVCDEQRTLCDEKKITTTPTWEINGRMYEQVQELETLSRLTGCEL